MRSGPYTFSTETCLPVYQRRVPARLAKIMWLGWYKQALAHENALHKRSSPAHPFTTNLSRKELVMTLRSAHQSLPHAAPWKPHPNGLDLKLLVAAHALCHVLPGAAICTCRKATLPSRIVSNAGHPLLGSRYTHSQVRSAAGLLPQ